MKLIIDIPEKYIKTVQHRNPLSLSAITEVERAIAVGTPIPDNATNGEVFGKIMDYMFMDDAYITTDKHGYLHLRGVKDDWWNASYQKGGKR